MKCVRTRTGMTMIAASLKYDIQSKAVSYHSLFHEASVCILPSTILESWVREQSESSEAILEPVLEPLSYVSHKGKLQCK